nr:IS5 family transposase [Streptomyces qaidamensis]
MARLSPPGWRVVPAATGRRASAVLGFRRWLGTKVDVHPQRPVVCFCPGPRGVDGLHACTVVVAEAVRRVQWVTEERERAPIERAALREDPTKIHLAADGRCRPLAFVLTGGQVNDAPAFTEVMARLRVPRRRGRPRTRPDAVLADKAYPSRAIRGHLRGRGIRAVIPIRADQNIHRLRRGSRGGRPPAFDREAYKQRNTVERCINRLKQWRGIATRYEKTATIYLAGLHVAAIFLWSAR